MQVTCINLKEQFGRRYRVEYEESYFAEHGLNTRVEDPWLMIIPGQHGHICPWDETTLAVSTDRRGSVTKRIAALPYATVVQDGDDGISATFPADRIDEVAQLIKARRRRRLSETEKRRLVEAGAKYRFRHGAESDSEARPCDFEGRDDQVPVIQ